MEVLPPLDWELVGGEQVAGLLHQVVKNGTGKTLSGLLSSNPEKRSSAWDGIFRPVRQPEWWQGDSAYHAPAYTEPASLLEKRLKAGQFVVAAEPMVGFAGWYTHWQVVPRPGGSTEVPSGSQ